MSISVIVNTAARGEKSGTVVSSGGKSGVTHAQRIDLLESRILPRLLHDEDVDEVIVVGEWREPKEGERFRYVPCPSVQFDCTDALDQRQAGFEASSGRILVFLHDDHLPDEWFFRLLAGIYDRMNDWQVLVPRRMALHNEQWHTLNNGEAEGYVMGHASVMRRSVVEACPWRRVPKVFTWDVCSTLLLREAKASIRWVKDLVVCDLEAEIGARPWE